MADFWAFAANDISNWLSTAQTRDITERLFPAVGQSFYSQRATPLLKLVENASPGPHDMLFPACDHHLYRRAGFADHPNCRDNFLAALESEGIQPPIVPDPVNLFQNSPPGPDGRLEVLPSVNPPDASVTMQAQDDLVIAITACSVDFHPTNGGICTEIDVEIS